MHWFKRNPFFYSLLALLIAGVLGAMWMAARKRAVLVELQNQYEAKSQRLDRLIVRMPSPTKGNLSALEYNYSELYEAYDAVLTDLSLNTYDREQFFGRDPQSKTDAFFEIARYVEEARRMAANAGIAVEREERFGFSAYANVGPVDKDIAMVHRQVSVMRFLLRALFESEVNEFLNIQREDPNAVPVVSLGARNRNERQGDLFRLNPGDSLGTQGVLSSMAFRVTFKSQSISMRNFINRLVDSSLPLVICSIDVSGGEFEEAEYDRTQVAENPFANPDVGDQLIKAAQVPIISENESTFSVTIEFLDEVKRFDPPSVVDAEEGGVDAEV